MRKFFFISASLAALSMSASAHAADLAARPYTKAPPMAVAAYNWSGFYVGLNGGGGWSHKCWDQTATGTVAINPAIPQGCHDATGGIVGGQVGYRWQSASWVFGLEAQGDWADLKGSNVSNTFFRVAGDTTNQSKIDAIGLFTGQIGYSWNNALLYVKGGAAVTHDVYDRFVVNAAIVNPNFDHASETRWGGAVGIGGEFGFYQNWSVGIEYDHLFMGSRDNTFTTTAAPFATRTFRIGQDVDMVTARVNYRFGGPVVAKY